MPGFGVTIQGLELRVYLLRLSRECANFFYTAYIGIVFPYSLLSIRKRRVLGLGS